MDTIFNVKELCEYLTVKKATVYSWIRARSVPFLRAGGESGRLLLFSKQEIDEWLRRHRRKSR